jgi:hypothetical protein
MKKSTGCGCGGNHKIEENKVNDDLGTLHVQGTITDTEFLDKFEFTKRPTKESVKWVDQLISESVHKLLKK